MKIHVNGEERSFESSDISTIDLLEHLGLQNRRVAVEVNQRIVPRAQHAEHRLQDGDKIEIVHFVGGGA